MIKALLSHRYGSRGLPERILSTEFDLLRSEVKNNSDTINMKFSYNEDPDAAIEVDNLLEYCYELDENELPCRYRLIRLEKCFPNYNPKVENDSYLYQLVSLSNCLILETNIRDCVEYD